MDLDRLARCLAVFSTLDPIHFPLHHAQVFIEIALNEPVTFAHLQDKFALTHGSVSRTVAALGQENRKGLPGYRLVSVTKDPKEPRRFLVSLSPKGRALMRTLEST